MASALVWLERDLRLREHAPPFGGCAPG